MMVIPLSKKLNISIPLILLLDICLNMNTTLGQLKYPVTEKGDTVDEYFGNSVSDPYRWLEGDVRKESKVADWVKAQNGVAFGYIETLPRRKEIEERLTKLWNYEKYSAPFRRGDRYYFQKNDGLQNQYVLHRQDSLDGEASVLIDPNEWSKEGTTALGGMAFSDDGKYLAYGIQESGSDWRTWKVKEIETGKILEDELKWLKFGGVSWNRESTGFYYGRFDEPNSENEFTSLNLNQKVFFHELGTAQADDVLIHESPDHPKWGFSPTVTEDGRYLVLTVWKGTDSRYRIMYRDLDTEGSELLTLIDNFENEYSFLGNEGPVFYFKSDLNAPKKCILTIDTAAADQPAQPKVIIAEADEAMQDASIVGDFIIADYLKDAKSQVKLFDLSGKFVREVSFPGIGTASGFGGRRDHDETFYSFSSFNRPPSTFRYDLKTGESTLLREAKVDFNPDDYEVKQVFYKSKDGTRVPMFITHKKGIELNGKNPTLLYGYGGFNISLTPGFSVSRLQWIEMGGIFAMPNLRGGGEYGKDWHKAGTKLKKQNVFDDFIAAAQYLIDNKYTSSKNLAIKGRSNGGLLVGACITQRPELFGAALPGVGVMDMLRFQEFTAGRYWVDDYGSSKANAEEFAALLAYSPYHNLKDGTSYPATMVTTADTDDRVVPGHSFKFAARLQEAHTGDNPVIIRIETSAGHGAGKPTSKTIEEIADEWAFLAKHLEMTTHE